MTNIENILNYIIPKISEKQELSRQILVRESVIDTYYAGTLNNLDKNQLDKCPSCKGTGISIEEDIEKYIKQIDTIRPSSRVEIDQCHLKDKDLGRRVHLILEKAKPESTKYGFVGDDDLASILLAKVANPEEIVIVDIDKRLLNVIDAELKNKPQIKYDLIESNITKLKYERLKNHFETCEIVVTDPPYADDGMLSFIYLGMALLKLGGKIFIAMPYLSNERWTWDLMMLVQKELIDNGMLIEELWPGFCTYETSDVISSFMVVKKMRNTDPHILLNKIDHLTKARFYTKRTNVSNIE
ncbi:MAG TPA: hypothetical protein DCP90_00495 [Clostridiales bacterium]|nr:MAG: hypothetical protein A2Y22_08340 [Clostridiales bacterium GWD2_32_59]HAN09075.1 hypothetical protein [Clostridiales bacterium]